jgi:hypothetical protein
LFGLLVPNLRDTEIFGPICQGMSEAPQARKNALLWGNIAAEHDMKDPGYSVNNTSPKRSPAFFSLHWSGLLQAMRPTIV